MQRVVASGQPLLTHNYVLIETVALLQRRLGMPSARAFLSDAQNFTVHWVTPDDHAEAAALFEQHNRRGLSLVDCMSFVVMRKYRCSAALAYDADFQAEGFDVFE